MYMHRRIVNNELNEHLGNEELRYQHTTCPLLGKLNLDYDGLGVWTGRGEK